MKFAFIDAEKANFPVSFMCRELRVSRSGYYAWLAREPSKRSREEAELVGEIEAVHAASRGTYGSPRVHKALRSKGRPISRKRVARIMRKSGLAARGRRAFRRTTDSDHAFPTAPNLLVRRFVATAPNQVWVTDITYVETLEGWLYVAAIIDLFSRRVVGWGMSERIDRRLCLDALEMAVKARKPPRGLVHHSDRGSQYASTEYRRALRAHGMTCSMSRRGDCWDNAVAESFWATLKAELIRGAAFATRTQARQAIFEYIEVFYNRRRLHSTVAYCSPADHEARYYQSVAA